ncbi:Metallo-dependent phosphatase [Artomyces pyxidatus]|uniref:Metallo-dependent phosphatase n=1 Tax=Artomyces pyxidatus TaxID=48021 RepID=A0ACB8SMJ8_9AGAM|nr:Metallo-dependent phosphatase [Artomyces pyxidatus]
MATSSETLTPVAAVAVEPEEHEPRFALSTPSAAVYDDYGKAPPSHPGEGWTRFVCISDTHSRVYPVPPGDVLIHAGDLSSWGSFAQLEVTVKWLMELPHPTKVVIAGNHDVHWVPRRFPDVEKACNLMASKAARDAGIHYLEYESMEIPTESGKRWKVYGSPAAPRYVPGSFQYKTPQEAEEIYNKVPADTEILMTHTPPHLTLDKARRGVRAGCPQLTEALAELKDCRLHVFGHIHEAHGAEVQEDPAGHTAGRVSVNAALPWGGQAVVVDLKDFA